MARKQRPRPVIMSSNEETTKEPNHLTVDARPAYFHIRAAGNLTVTVTRAHDIEVEDSDTEKVLRLRNGDYACFKRAYLVIDGERHEITVDSMPAT